MSVYFTEELHKTHYWGIILKLVGTGKISAGSKPKPGSSHNNFLYVVIKIFNGPTIFVNVGGVN